jgi:hypothetical protein
MDIEGLTPAEQAVLSYIDQYTSPPREDNPLMRCHEFSTSPLEPVPENLRNLVIGLCADRGYKVDFTAAGDGKMVIQAKFLSRA